MAQGFPDTDEQDDAPQDAPQAPDFMTRQPSLDFGVPQPQPSYEAAADPGMYGQEDFAEPVIAHRGSTNPQVERALEFQGQQQAAAIQQQAAQQKRRLNVTKAEDYRLTQTPFYTDYNGNVAPVRDFAGAPITQYDEKNNVGWDSQGNAVQIKSNGLSQPPTVQDAFTNVPLYTDPKTGDVYQRRNGIPWRWVGQDSTIADQVQQKAVDKLNAQSAAFAGGQISQESANLNKARVAATHSAQSLLQSNAVPATTDDGQQMTPQMLAQMEPDAVNKLVNDNFDTQLKAPEANAKGFFGGGLTSDAKALRDSIEKQRQDALTLLATHTQNLQDIAQHSDAWDRITQIRAGLQGANADSLNRERIAAGLDPLPQVVNPQVRRQGSNGSQAQSQFNDAQAVNAGPAFTQDANGYQLAPGRHEEAINALVRQNKIAPVSDDIMSAARDSDAQYRGVQAALNGQRNYTIDPSTQKIQFKPGSLQQGMKEATADRLIDEPTQADFDQAGIQDKQYNGITAARAGQRAYSVDDNQQIQFRPGQLLKGIREASEDQLVPQDRAQELAQDAKVADEAWQAREDLVRKAGGWSQVKALAHGAGLGAAFLATAPIGAGIGAEAGAATGPLAPVAVPVLSTLGGLISGGLGAYATKKALEKIGEYSETIDAFNKSADLHPYYDATGNLIALAAGIPKVGMQAVGQGIEALAPEGEGIASKAIGAIGSGYKSAGGGLKTTIENLAQDASIRAEQGVGKAQIARAIVNKVGGSALANVAIDTIINQGAQALGLQDHGETLPGAVQAALVGAFISGHNIQFQNYEPAEIADILTRAKIRREAGLGISDAMSVQDIAAKYPQADAVVAHALSRPLTSKEAEVYNAVQSEVISAQNRGQAVADDAKFSARQGQIAGEPYGVTSAKIHPADAGGSADSSSQPSPPPRPESQNIDPSQASPVAAPEEASPVQSASASAGGESLSPQATVPESGSYAAPRAITPQSQFQSTSGELHHEDLLTEKARIERELQTPPRTALDEAFQNAQRQRLNVIQSELAQTLPRSNAGATFTTAKGSVYSVNDDGSTVRNKAARPEHPGDSGVKNASTKTIYVTPETAQNILDHVNLMHEEGDGTITLDQAGNPVYGVVNSREGKWIRTSPIEVASTEPKVGLQPVEFWNSPDGLRNDGFHIGNKITEVRENNAAPANDTISEESGLKPHQSPPGNPAIGGDGARSSEQSPRPYTVDHDGEIKLRAGQHEDGLRAAAEDGIANPGQAIIESAREADARSPYVDHGNGEYTFKPGRHRDALLAMHEAGEQQGDGGQFSPTPQMLQAAHDADLAHAIANGMEPPTQPLRTPAQTIIPAFRPQTDEHLRYGRGMSSAQADAANLEIERLSKLIKLDMRYDLIDEAIRATTRVQQLREALAAHKQVLQQRKAGEINDKEISSTTGGTGYAQRPGQGSTVESVERQHATDAGRNPTGAGESRGPAGRTTTAGESVVSDISGGRAPGLAAVNGATGIEAGRAPTESFADGQDSGGQGVDERPEEFSPAREISKAIERATSAGIKAVSSGEYDQPFAYLNGTLHLNANQIQAAAANIAARGESPHGWIEAATREEVAHHNVEQRILEAGKRPRDVYLATYESMTGGQREALRRAYPFPLAYEHNGEVIPYSEEDRQIAMGMEWLRVREMMAHGETLPEEYYRDADTIQNLKDATDAAEPSPWVPESQQTIQERTEEANGSRGPPASIEDFGEKIQGARKELWGNYKKAIGAALPEDVSDITLSKNFPEPDYEVAIKNGVPVDSLATFKAMRDLIPPKPRQAYKLKRWAELVRMAHGVMQKMVTGDSALTPEKIDQIASATRSRELASKISLYKRLGYPAFTHAKDWGIVQALSYYDAGGKSVDKGIPMTMAEYKGRLQQDMRVDEHNHAAIEKVSDMIKGRIEQQIAQADEPAPKAITFGIYHDRLKNEYFVGKKAVNGVVRLKTGFDAIKPARQYLDDNREELKEQWNGLKAHPDYRRPINAPRQGPVRREGDVAPEQFQDAFGFRGVQFGNYVEGDRRQLDLNEAYDALMDMSEALGVPPKALSLDGSLGLAFGARGSGGNLAAKAHYEPGEVVINLTKKSGPGSLAHEWFHAFDNYFARLDKTGETKPVPLDRFSTQYPKPAVNMRPEVWKAFEGIRNAVGHGTFAERSKELDDARSKPYYSTTIEKAARAFERYVVDKLESKDISNDYLVNIKKDKSPALPTQDEMKGGITQAYDQLFNTLDTKPTDKGLALFAGDPTNLDETTADGGNSLGDKDTAHLQPGDLVHYDGRTRKVKAVRDEGAVKRDVQRWVDFSDGSSVLFHGPVTLPYLGNAQDIPANELPAFSGTPEDERLQLAGHRAFLDGPAVRVLVGNEFSKVPGQSLVDRVAEFYRVEHGGLARSPVLGDVVLNRRSVKDSLAHGLGREKAAAFAAVPEIIAHGRVLDAVGDAENGTHVTIGAPINIAGEPYVAVAVVRKSPEGNRFYLHEVGLRSALQQDAFKTGRDAEASLHSAPEGAIKNLLRRIYSVNPNVGKRVTLPNGKSGVVTDVEGAKGIVRLDEGGSVTQRLDALDFGSGGSPAFAGNPITALHNKAVDRMAAVRRAATAQDLKGDIAAKYDAVGTVSNYKGAQAASKIRLDIPNPKDREAMPFVIEAGGDRSKLAQFKAKVAVSSDKKLSAKYGPVVDYALQHFNRLNGLRANHDSMMRQSFKRLTDAGVKVNEVDDYVTRKLSLPENGKDTIPAPLFDMGSGGESSPKYFTKGRAFETLADAIKAGYTPKSTDLADLDGHRIAAAERILEHRKMLDQLRATKSPTDGKPILENLETRETPGGSVELVVPRGYSMVNAGGYPLVVHNDFAGLFKALYGESAIRRTIIGRGALKAAALAKHGTLVLDTFHTGRLLFKMATGGGGSPVTVRDGKPTFNIHSGLSLLEYDDADLARAVSTGEITQREADYAKAMRPDAERLMRAGLNVGRSADNLMEQAHLHIPVLSTYNNWLFQKLARGAMLQTSLEAYRRNLRGGSVSPEVAARQTTKEMNEFFGNLQNQGIFTSKTMQDIARLIFLAPNWAESQMRYEGRAYGQAGKSAYNFVRSGGKDRFAGNSIRAMAAGFAALFLANQVVNYLTRNKPTWKNPEDGHKLDAWIPGGAHGFWFNPFQIVGEYSHAAMKYFAQHENPLDIATHILTNKLSPIARGVKEGVTGRDYAGRHFLSNADRARAAITDALPMPIGLNAVLEKDPRQPFGYRITRQPSAAMKQALQSAGAQMDAEQSPRAKMFSLAQPFRADKGYNDNAGLYTELRHALDNNDAKSAVSEIQWLQQQGKSLEAIREAVGERKGGGVKPELFTGSKDAERQFVSSMTSYQRSQYNQAQADHARNVERLIQIMATHNFQTAARPTPVAGG